MIRAGRAVMDRAEVIATYGLSERTAARKRPWAQPGHPQPVNRPGGRKPALWDEAQIVAYAAGEPVPALPTADHPDDLLDAEEVGQLSGISAASVLRHAKGVDEPPFDYVPAADSTVFGLPHWRRHTITQWLATRPGRGVGGGRPNRNGLSNSELLERARTFYRQLGREPGVRELARELRVSPYKAAKIRAEIGTLLVNE